MFYLTFSLEDFDLDVGLSISGGRKDLRFLGGDGGIAVDKAGEDSSEGFNSQREGGDIKKKNVGHVSWKDSSLDSSSNSDGLIWVNAFVCLSLKDVLNNLLNLGHSCHS